MEVGFASLRLLVDRACYFMEHISVIKTVSLYGSSAFGTIALFVGAS